MPNINIDEKHFIMILTILKKYLASTDIVFAFGSRTKFTNKKYSDLDLAIVTDNNLLQLKESFEESDLPFTVDCLNYKNIPESFRKEIDRSKVQINFL